MTDAPPVATPTLAPAVARWQDFVALMKPRVMSLVVFTAVAGMLCSGAPLNPWLGAIDILCIAIGAGGSAALNMGYEGDIDGLMRRTRRRPVAAGRVQRQDALALGGTLSLFSVCIMGLAANWLAAGLLAFTIFFYGVVYTLWLKRRTPHNIVIGGLAGALPPAVGWAAASGTAPLNAWILVAIIFVWTPPHFWAMSLFSQEDYAAAGVPMLPVVKGGPATRLQILLYSLVLAPLGVLPALTGLAGVGYLATSAIGGLVFVALAISLAMSREGDARDTARGGRPRRLFAFSIFYLFALFAALMVERLAGVPALGRLL